MQSNSDMIIDTTAVDVRKDLPKEERSEVHQCELAVKQSLDEFEHHMSRLAEKIDSTMDSAAPTIAAVTATAKSLRKHSPLIGAAVVALGGYAIYRIFKRR